MTGCSRLERGDFDGKALHTIEGFVQSVSEIADVSGPVRVSIIWVGPQQEQVHAESAALQSSTLPASFHFEVHQRPDAATLGAYRVDAEKSVAVSYGFMVAYVDQNENGNLDPEESIVAAAHNQLMIYRDEDDPISPPMRTNIPLANAADLSTGFRMLDLSCIDNQTKGILKEGSPELASTDLRVDADCKFAYREVCLLRDRCPRTDKPPTDDDEEEPPKEECLPLGRDCSPIVASHEPGHGGIFASNGEFSFTVEHPYTRQPPRVIKLITLEIEYNRRSDLILNGELLPVGTPPNYDEAGKRRYEVTWECNVFEREGKPVHQCIYTVSGGVYGVFGTGTHIDVTIEADGPGGKSEGYFRLRSI